MIEVKVHSYGSNRPLSLVYFDPITGKKIAKSAETTNRQKAEKKAAILENDLNTGRYKPTSKITWKEFRERFEREHVTALAPDSQTSYRAALNHLERVVNPDRLSKLTTAVISEFKDKLRQPRTVERRGKPVTIPGMKETTLNTTCRHIKAALRWAQTMGLMAEAPKIQASAPKAARARPVLAEEFDRMVAAVSKVRPDDADDWTELLNGLWLSGLRLGEATILSWEADAPFAVDLSGRRPRFRIYSEAQKARRDETLPMTPDFAEWLLNTFPESERQGPVFKVFASRTGEPMTENQIGRTISRIGHKAGVVVNRDAGKFASAHDLRRSFGTRWAKRVMPAMLQKLMRHAHVETTMKYYVGIDADSMADELWSRFGNRPASGNTSGNNQGVPAGATQDATDATPLAN